MEADTDDILDKAVDVIQNASFWLSGLWFLGILGYQAYQWLRVGEWKSLPLSNAFTYTGADLTSVYRPETWIGLATIFQWVLDLPLSVMGAIIIVSAATFLRVMVREVL